MKVKVLRGKHNGHSAGSIIDATVEEYESFKDRLEIVVLAEEVEASPAAIKLAQEKGVDLATVDGTGSGGRIIKTDIVAVE